MSWHVSVREMAARSSLAASPSEGLRECDLIYVYEALNSVQTKYTFLGLLIGVTKTEIERIEADQSDSATRLLEVLSVRLKKSPALTWGDIDKALRSESIGEHQLANTLQTSQYERPGPSRGRSSCDSASDQEPPQKMYKRGNKSSRKRKFEGDTSPAYRSKTSRVEDSDEVRSKGKRKAKRDHESFPTSSINPKESHAIDAKQAFERKIRKKKKHRRSVRFAEHGEKAPGKETRYLKSTKGKGKRKVLPVKKARNVKVLNLDSDSSQNDSECEEPDGSSSMNEENQDAVDSLSNEDEEATELDEESYSTVKESSGEETGRSNRHSKEKRDEVRPKHSDDRGKRYRESNISSIATSSTVKTRSSVTKLDEDSYPASEVCSGEGDRHRKGERDEVRSKHSDDRGKRYRKSNISPIATSSKVKSRSSKHSDDRGKRYRKSNINPIATSSTVKTRSSATHLHEDSYSAGEESSGEERGRSNHHRKGERDEVRSKHSDDMGKHYRKSNTSPIATSSTYPSNIDEEKYSKGKRKRSHYTRNISRRREEMEKGNSSSSTEMDDSSPECDMLKNLSETETQKLKNIFKCSFGKLCCAIKDPVEVGAQLQAKRLLSFSMMEDMLTSPESRQVKAITLVRTLYKRIKSRSDRIFTIIQVFLEKQVLHEVGRDLWFETGTISIISIFQHHDGFVLSLQEKCVLTEQHLCLAVSFLLLPLKENQLRQFLVRLPFTLFYSPSIIFQMQVR